MALDADVLGLALYNARGHFNNRTMDDLLGEYETANGIFLAVCKADAQAIIDHFTTHAVIPGTGLTAPDGPVTGETTIT